MSAPCALPARRMTVTMADQDDRRREARAPIELKVEYKRLNTFFDDYTKNISKGGTFIKTEKPLAVGTIFLFKLMLPAQSEPIALRGEVRWVVKDGEPLPPQVAEGHEAGMGIKFVYDSPDQRDQLEQIVERMMIDSLGPLIYKRLVKKPKRDESRGPRAARSADEHVLAAGAGGGRRRTGGAPAATGRRGRCRRSGTRRSGARRPAPS